MSVLVKDRGESVMEFMNTAFELEKFTIQACHRENVIPKRYRLSKGMDLMRSANIIGNNVVYANSIFPKTREEHKMRAKYQRSAIREIQIMLKDLRLVSEILPIKDTTLEEWTGLLLKEEGSIKSWMRSDAKRFKDLE